MSTRPRDTAPAAWSAQAAVLERMGGSARVLAAVELSDAIRGVRIAGIRARNPDLDHRRALSRLISEDYGVDLPPTS